MGDPIFYGYSTGIQASHSYICSSLDWKADQLYSSHSSDVCDGDYLQSSGTNVKLLFFHIKSAYPDHCDDCEQNYDEEGVDCGGPCPPCERAPVERSITTATNDLPTVVRAVKKITAGNAAVKVLSGQNVSFHTAGSIVLLPGFEVQAGGNFNAQVKSNILGVIADCNEYCDPTIYTLYDRWCPWPWPHTNGTFCVDVANVFKIYLEVYRRYNSYWVIDEVGEFVYSNLVENLEGKVPLWDLIEGESPEYLKPDFLLHKYWAYLEIYPCEWGGEGHWSYWRKFAVKNDPTPHKNDPTYKMVKNDELFNELDSMNQMLHADIDNIMSLGETTSPHFTIIPNPNSGVFHLETNFSLSEISNLKISNLLGVTVFETQNVTEHTLKLQNSASGVFFVVMILKDGTMIRQKMVIQK